MESGGALSVLPPAQYRVLAASSMKTPEP